MHRDTRKYLRRMLDISTKPQMRIAPKVEKAIDDLELFMGRVTKQYGCHTETYALLLTTLGGELVVEVDDDGNIVVAPNKTPKGAWSNIAVNTPIKVMHHGVENEGFFQEVVEKDGRQYARVRLKNDAAKFRDVEPGDLRLTGEVRIKAQ